MPAFRPAYGSPAFAGDAFKPLLLLGVIVVVGIIADRQSRRAKRS